MYREEGLIEHGYLHLRRNGLIVYETKGGLAQIFHMIHRSVFFCPIPLPSRSTQVFVLRDIVLQLDRIVDRL